MDKKELAKVIGFSIRKARNFRNLQSQELANAIGIKKPILSKYESGSILPSLDILLDISNVLSIGNLIPMNEFDYKSMKKEYENNLEFKENLKGVSDE